MTSDNYYYFLDAKSYFWDSKLSLFDYFWDHSRQKDKELKSCKKKTKGTS